MKQARERRDRTDTLMRDAEVTATELREAIKQSTFEALRPFIQARLRDGSLPHDIDFLLQWPVVQLLSRLENRALAGR